MKAGLLLQPSRHVSSSLLVELLKAPWRDEEED